MCFPPYVENTPEQALNLLYRHNVNKRILSFNHICFFKTFCCPAE